MVACALGAYAVASRSFWLLLLATGWIGIFDCFIRYKADRLVALHTQILNLLKATCFATFWLMIMIDNTLHLSINYAALRWL